MSFSTFDARCIIRSHIVVFGVYVLLTSLVLQDEHRFTRVFDFDSLVKDILKIFDVFVPCIFDCFHYYIMSGCVMQIFYDNL